MILYHGSLVKVERPVLLQPSRTLDYGSGFYTTTSFEQALQWVKRKATGKESSGFINLYELEEASFKTLRVLRFGEPTEQWVDFVMKNRTEVGFQHDYDIVYGPVANDKVYAQFALYEAGLISKATLIQELKTYLLIDQMLFHTEAALSALAFVEAKEVEL